MGKSKGGGGSHGADIQGIETALQGQSTQFQNLGDWERQFISTPYDIGNYYMNLATGGTGPQYSGGQGGWSSGAVNPYGGNLLGGGTGTSGGGTGWGGGGTWGPSINPWVSGLEQGLGGMQGLIGQEMGAIPQLQGYQNWFQDQSGQEFGYAGKELSTANQEANRAYDLQTQLAHSGGLFPDQQALIKAQVEAGQNQVAQQLSSQGLGQSTMGKELGAEIGLQGAATGGQLIQGNQQVVTGAYGAASQQYSVANQANAIGNAAVGTAFAGQQQFFNELANLGQQNLQFGEANMQAQQQFFSQALQGYGASGQALNNVLAPYGYQLQDYQAMMSGALGNAQIQAGLQSSAMQSQATGLSGLFSGLSSLIGGGGLGGLGGAGAAGGLAADGTSVGAFIGGSGGAGFAGGVGSALGGIGGGISSVLGSVGSWIGPLIGAILSL